MPIDLSEFTMPMHVNLDGFKGGFDYQDFRTPGGTALTHYWEVADINTLDISGLLGPFEESAHGELLAIQFSNGWKLKIDFEYRASGSSNGYIYLGRRLYDNNDVLQTQTPSISGVTWFGTGSMMSITARAYIYPFVKAKVFLNTVYYPQTPGSPSHPTNVKLSMVVSGACNAYQYDEGGNDLRGFNSGLVNAYYNLTNYSGVAHDYGVLDLITFTSNGLNNFNDWLNGTGGGGGFVPSGGGGGGTPAGGDDTSEPGGGDGNYDDTSDPIDFPDLPTGGALESGSLIAHRVVSQTLEVIFTKLWDLTLINTWLKSLEDPMDAIVSLHALPVSPQVVSDPNNIYIGNLDMGISSPLVTSQYVAVDCGSLTLNEFWGSALDYSPYTRVEIYLPFIGVRTLKTEDVMKTTIAIKYYVDVLTGDCIAFIKCGISVLYTFNGNCKMSIPLSARSTDALQKVLVAAGLAVAGGSVAVGGGAAAAAATKAPQIAAAGLTAEAANMQAGSLMLSSAANIASTKINVSRSGDVTGSPGIMGEYVPYLIIHRPVQSLAKDYNKFKGYTANLTKKLGDLSGYTEVEYINLQGIPNATADEMAEIKSLLTSGVIF